MSGKLTEEIDVSRDLSPAHNAATPKSAAIEARMLSGEDFTYGELVSARAKAGDGGRTGDDDRLIDRTIQRLRRKGLIAWRRSNGRVVWATVGGSGPTSVAAQVSQPIREEPALGTSAQADREGDGSSSETLRQSSKGSASDAAAKLDACEP